MENNKPSWKAKTEAFFGQLSLLISKHPWWWLLGCMLIIGTMATQLLHLRKDTSIEGFLEKGSAEIQYYDRFREIFGRDETFIISLEVDDIFNQQFVDRLRNLHERIESEVPHVFRVDSLINARHTYGADDTLYIDEILPRELPKDPAELQKLKDYTYGNPNYTNFLISDDGKVNALVVRLEPYRYVKDAQGNTQKLYLSEEDQIESLIKLEELIAEQRGVLSNEIRLAGPMPISLKLGKILQRDFTVFSSLANLLIGIVLFVIFRRWSGVFMPLLIMGLGTAVTMSLMAIMDTPMQVSTSILPSFLLAVCVGDSIHLLTMFYSNYDKGEEKSLALKNAMEHTALAMLFTSITTAAGLASFAFSELTAVSALGLYGALGSLIAFLLTIFILPCLISILPIKRRPLENQDSKALHKLLGWSARTAIKYPKPIVFVGVILLLGSGFFASQSKFSHYPIEWLPKHDQEYQSIKYLEEKMGTNLAIEVMLDTGKDRGIINPAFMQALNKLQREVETWETENYKVVKTIGIANIVKESNRALHDNQQTYFSIPDNPDLISQELFLVELDEPDDLYQYIDRGYQIARLTIMIPWVDSIHLTKLLDRLQQALDNSMAVHTREIIMTGVTAVLGDIFYKMLYSTAESYGIALITITLMMTLLIGNLKLGLLSMIPSLLPILIVLSGIHLAGTPLDMLTMLIGSIAIGLTVDDNVHFMHGFRRLYRKTGDPEYAITATLLSSGRAMLITSLVLSIGFIIYTQSEMNNMVNFGIMTALCIMLALMATFLLAPALMILANKRVAPKAGNSTKLNTTNHSSQHQQNASTSSPLESVADWQPVEKCHEHR